MSKNYILTITPALSPKLRHQIENALKGLLYEVSGGGTAEDLSSCDISFTDIYDDCEDERPENKIIFDISRN